LTGFVSGEIGVFYPKMDVAGEKVSSPVYPIRYSATSFDSKQKSILMLLLVFANKVSQKIDNVA
jgi:hypothetical protein